jgi:hypoxanthine-DNA glycosylase
MKTSGFEPVARTNARVLILGTMPSTKSLECRQYYANRGNLFWSIMAEILGSSCELSYTDREEQLKNNRIALWDVCKTACRSGSLDSAIRLADVVPNELGAFLSAHKNIELICFNGSKAARIYQHKVLQELPLEFQSIRREILPSTSPAPRQDESQGEDISLAIRTGQSFVVLVVANLALRFAARWPTACGIDFFSSVPGTYSSAAQARLGNVPGYYHSSRVAGLEYRATRFLVDISAKLHSN